MAAVTKQTLSGSTNGRGILVDDALTPGLLIHTAVNVANQLDEIYLWAVNSSAAAVKLTIEFGGTSDPADLIEFTVPAEDGLYMIVPGLVLDQGVIVRAFAGTINVISLFGYVNRIDQS